MGRGDLIGAESYPVGGGGILSGRWGQNPNV